MIQVTEKISLQVTETDISEPINMLSLPCLPHQRAFSSMYTAWNYVTHAEIMPKSDTP